MTGRTFRYRWATIAAGFIVVAGGIGAVVVQRAGDSVVLRTVALRGLAYNVALAGRARRRAASSSSTAGR